MVSTLSAAALVFHTPEDLDLLRYMAAATQRERRRDGLPPSRAVTALTAAMSPGGHPVTSNHPTNQAGHNTTGMVEVIGTGEAAQLLGVSPRQARRLAPRLDGQKVGGVYTIPLAAIEQHLEGTT